MQNTGHIWHTQRSQCRSFGECKLVCSQKLTRLCCAGRACQSQRRHLLRTKKADRIIGSTRNIGSAHLRTTRSISLSFGIVSATGMQAAILRRDQAEEWLLSKYSSAGYERDADRDATRVFVRVPELSIGSQSDSTCGLHHISLKVVSLRKD